MPPTAILRPNRAGAIEQPVLHTLMNDGDLDDMHEVLRGSFELLNSTSLTQLDDIEDFASARKQLEAAWSAVVDALTGDAEATEEVSRADILALLRRLRAADDRLCESDARRRQDVPSSVREALVRFRHVATSDQLLELAPKVVCGLGFDRALVSRIEDSSWVTDTICVVGDSDWAAEIVALGRDNPQRLAPAVPETEIVRRRAPALVTQVQNETERARRRLAEATLSRSYVAAPIMRDSDVVGFLHADRYYHRGDVDEFDRDLLAAFSEGFSFALERALLLDRIEAMRTQVNRIASGEPLPGTTTSPAATAGSKPVGAGWSSARDCAVRGLTRTSEPASLLTRRETDVLRLMAAGETNRRIASVLVISEGTVKSHVKHILRKLGAANRAEAVSRWLMHRNSQPGG